MVIYASQLFWGQTFFIITSPQTFEELLIRLPVLFSPESIKTISQLLFLKPFQMQYWRLSL